MQATPTAKRVTRKIMLLGEIGVGKTSIARRLMFNKFEENYKATIGSDVYPYDMDPPINGIPFRFLVWDTDGSFGTAILKHVSIRKADAAIIVGDATRPTTIETMAQLADAFSERLPGRYLSFVVNKFDLLDPAEKISLPERIAEYGVPIMQTSAKTGSNVKDTFIEAAETILRRGRTNT